MNWKRGLCFIGLHDWRSVYVGEIPASTIVVGSVCTVSTGRTMWDNACQRCGKFVPLTYRYQASEGKEG